ncbi:MAG: glycosyltransferase family 4 protein [Solirubrobacterales bacterium]
MRIWLVTVGEPLPLNGNEVRLLRAGILARLLLARGHDVTWWTSSFNHSQKRQHTDETIELQLPGEPRMILLHGTAYQKNLSPLRIVNHVQIAREFGRLCAAESRPDIILCSFPTIELSRAAVEYGRRNRVPVILDVRDLWPDIFADVAPGMLRPLARMLLFPAFHHTRQALAHCTAVIGISKEYLEWGLKAGSRAKTDLDRVFPLGYEQREWPAYRLAEAGEILRAVGAAPDRFLCWFAGMFGRTYDLSTVIEAARLLERRSPNRFQFILCGTGERYEEWTEQASGLSSVVFPGWVDAAQLAWLMKSSKAGLAAYAAGAPQGLPNKVFEFLCAGIPVISSLRGETEQLLSEYECGMTYTAGDPESLAGVLTRLADNEAVWRALGENARRLFEARFDARQVYGDLADYLEETARSF